MSSPRRLLEAPTTEAERQVALAASVEAAPLPGAGWDEVLGRAVMRRPSPWRLVPAFALSALAGVLLVLLVRPVVRPAPRQVELVAAADTKWTQVSAEEVALESGRLTFSRPRGRPVRVRTPHVVLETANARFLAEVTASGTTVVVEEGEVVLRAPTSTRTVHAGEAVTWPLAPEIPSALEPGTPAPGGKCQGSGAAVRACLELEARGASMDAEAAAWELGALEAREGNGARAVEVWTEALTRFPDGMLAPELRIALVVELVKARRFPEAKQQARAFIAAWPDDPRRAEMQKLATALEQGGATNP